MPEAGGRAGPEVMSHENRSVLVPQQLQNSGEQVLHLTAPWEAQ